MSVKAMLPNFLIIGAAKSGTTTLWHYLNQHPDIYMCPRKEPHFLSYQESIIYTQGPNDFKYEIADIDAYRALFKGVVNEKAIGEASTNTLYFSESIKRIKQYIPHAKLIAMLRQPADRAYSAFMHVTRDGREQVKDFKSALQLEEERIRQKWSGLWHYKNGGFYYKLLKPFYDTFGPERIRVYLFDDFRVDPLSIVQDIFRFLEVDSQFVPNTKVSLNESGLPQNLLVNRLLHMLFDKPNPLRYISHRIFREDTRILFQIYMRRNFVRYKKPAIPPEIRRELTELYREDILKLQSLIEKDLSRWLDHP